MGGIPGLVIGGWGGRYKFHRPYVRGFAVNWPHGSSIIPHTNGWTVLLNEVAPGWYKRYTFESRFWEWTSNGYTMDWILTQYEIFDPSDVSHGNGENFSLGYRYRPDTVEWFYTLDVGFWGDWYYIEVPPAPTAWFVPLP